MTFMGFDLVQSGGLWVNNAGNDWLEVRVYQEGYDPIPLTWSAAVFILGKRLAISEHNETAQSAVRDLENMVRDIINGVRAMLTWRG